MYWTTTKTTVLTVVKGLHGKGFGVVVDKVGKRMQCYHDFYPHHSLCWYPKKNDRRAIGNGGQSSRCRREIRAKLYFAPVGRLIIRDREMMSRKPWLMDPMDPCGGNATDRLHVSLFSYGQTGPDVLVNPPLQSDTDTSPSWLSANW